MARSQVGGLEWVALAFSWASALLALITCGSLVTFISNQNGLARGSSSPNCSALMDCAQCRFARNFTAHILGRANSPQWEHFRQGLWHDIVLLVAFGLQHSLMATDWWKDRFAWLKPLGRTVYVVATVLCLQAILQTWAPLNIALWCVDTNANAGAWWLYTCLHSLFWLILCGNLIVLDVSELCGVKQCHCTFFSGIDDPLSRKSPELRRLYRHLRHPGLIPGFLLIFVHPVMTFDRIVLGSAFVCYFLARSRLDEDDVEYGNRMLRWKKEETSPKKVRF